MESDDRIGAALVTGASSGIGRAIAVRLAASGYELIATGRNESALEELRRELRPRRVHLFRADLTGSGAVERLHELVLQERLSVEVLVNSAGFGDIGRFCDSDPAKQMDMIRVNISSLVELTHRLLGPMRARRRGYVVNVASTAGFAPGPFMAVYYATKAFVVSFSLALAEELYSEGVSVSVVCPGATRTGFDRAAGLERERESGGRVMEADRVAAVTVAGMFARKRLIVPGLFNKISVTATRLIGRGAAARYVLRFNSRK